VKQQIKTGESLSDERAASRTELQQANAVFRGKFPHSAGAIPYFHSVGRGLLPPEWSRPALIVPLDGHYVVEQPVVNRPVSWLSREFAADLPAFLGLLDKVRDALDAAAFPNHDLDGTIPYFPNPYFGPMDATALAGMIAALRPHRLIEIGSGISTRIARHTIDSHGLATRLLAIDPAPRAAVAAIAESLPSSLLDADPAIFDELQADDILFFDGSHLSFSGTDCSHLFLEILPRLASGVYVHVHDIFLPNDYPERLRNRFYNEQQLLAAFLAGNRDYRVVLPINHLHVLGYCPEGVSFWLKRV
jgi:hypothetical protein